LETFHNKEKRDTAAMNRLLLKTRVHTSQARLLVSVIFNVPKTKYKKYEGIAAQVIEVQKLSGRLRKELFNSCMSGH